MAFDRVAENRIREAMKNGEFDNLSNAGQPIDLDAYFAMPEDVRMAYSILKSANCVPEEVALLNDIARLQQVVQGTCNARARDEAAIALRDQELRLSVLRDHRRTRDRKLR